MSEGLPERLQSARRYLKMSVPAICDRAGLKDRKTWERYEKGETRPNSDTLSALYEMGIDANWLLTGEGSMLRTALPDVPQQGGAGTAYTQDDRLYDIAIKATLRWYDAAGLEAPPDALAGMITRAVRMLRGRPDAAAKTDAELAEDVGAILDVAREMLSSGGWSPKGG